MAALLGLGVLAVVGNTIRLEILNRRAEIEVTKLVGGSNGFVRGRSSTPACSMGSAVRCSRGAPSESMVIVLPTPVATLASSMAASTRSPGPACEDTASLLGGGALLGWLGAWISANRHLRSIEPRANAPTLSALSDTPRLPAACRGRCDTRTPCSR